MVPAPEPSPATRRRTNDRVPANTAAIANPAGLRYPVIVLTRGAPTGSARAFVDWLRATDVAATLREASVVAGAVSE